MKNNLKLYFFLFMICSICCISCQKEESVNNPTDPIIEIDGTLHKHGVLLNWTQTNLEDFENYVVVRSQFPLPTNFEPTFESNLTRQFITNQDSNLFFDEALPIVDLVYYTVFVDLGNRYLRSDEIQLDLDFYLLDFDGYEYYFNPSNELLYLVGNTAGTGHLAVFDVQSKAFIATKSFNSAEFDIPFAFSKTPPEEVYFGGGELGNATYEIFDAYTLENKATFMDIDPFWNGQFQTNNLGHLCFKNEKWQILNAADASTFTTFPSETESFHLFNYNNNDLEYIAVGFDRIEYVKFHENGSLAGFTNTNVNKEPSPGMAISPDGQQFFAYLDGSLYDKNFILLNQLGGGDEFFTGYAFSENGEYVFAINRFTRNIEQYAFPELTLVATIDLSYTPQNIFFHQNKMICIGKVGIKYLVHVFEVN